MELRVTRRALEDLGLDGSLAGRSAEFLADKHQVVASFVQLRSQSPSGQEATKLPSTRVPVWNLHAGRWRALTWHDTDNDVVWLLGAGYHESGSIDDAYEVLKRRDEAGGLLPSLEDFEDLEPSADHFVDELAKRSGALRDAALGNPDQIVAAVLCDALRVRLVSNGDRLFVGFALPPLRTGVIPPDWLMAAAAAFMTEVSDGDIDWNATFPIPLDGSGVAYEVVLAAGADRLLAGEGEREP